jgi:hypothetical protein
MTYFIFPAAALPPAALTGSQVPIAIDGSYAWDYTTDLYNGTSGALLEWDPALDFADMNASEYSEGVGDFTFTHTFAGDLSAWYIDEGNAEQILQSYWFYFPVGYETSTDDTANITIFVHWGVVGTGFLSYVWFMNFSCYLAYDWTNLTHLDSTANLVQNDPVNYVDGGVSIETTISSDYFVATQEWIGAITIATITATTGTFDFWPEYGSGTGGRNLLQDRADVQPEFQAFVDLFDGVFGIDEEEEEEEDPDADDDDADDDGSSSSSSSNEDPADTDSDTDPVISWWDAHKSTAIPIFILIIVAIIISQIQWNGSKKGKYSKWNPPAVRPRKKTSGKRSRKAPKRSRSKKSR